MAYLDIVHVFEFSPKRGHARNKDIEPFFLGNILLTKLICVNISHILHIYHEIVYIHCILHRILTIYIR